MAVRRSGRRKPRRLPAELWARVLDAAYATNLVDLEPLRLISVEWRNVILEAARAAAALDEAESVDFLRRRWACGAVGRAHAPALLRIAAEAPPANLCDPGPRFREDSDDESAASNMIRVRPIVDPFQWNPRLYRAMDDARRSFDTRRRAAIAALAAVVKRGDCAEHVGVAAVPTLMGALDECALCGGGETSFQARWTILCPQCGATDRAEGTRSGPWETRRKHLVQRSGSIFSAAFLALGTLGTSAASALPMLLHLLGAECDPDAQQLEWSLHRHTLADAILAISFGATSDVRRSHGNALVAQMESHEWYANADERYCDGWRAAVENVLTAFGLPGILPSQDRVP